VREKDNAYCFVFDSVANFLSVGSEDYGFFLVLAFMSVRLDVGQKQ
jgi:hypothetical protein